MHTPVALTVEKKELLIAIPYLGSLSLAIGTHLQNSINKTLSFRKINAIFKSTTCLSKFFGFKDTVTVNLCSNVVYKFSCGRCNATYCGETYRHLNVRVGEHSGVSSLTRKSRKLKQIQLLKMICSLAIT